MLGTHLISFILSQFFGMYLMIFGLLMLLRAAQYRRLINSLNPQSGTLLLGGLIGLMLGLFFVGIHNVWELKPTLFITLMCWFVLIWSILWLKSPEKMVLITQRMITRSRYYVISAVTLMLGLFFLSRGLYMYATQHQNFWFLP